MDFTNTIFGRRVEQADPDGVTWSGGALFAGGQRTETPIGTVQHPRAARAEVRAEVEQRAKEREERERRRRR